MHTQSCDRSRKGGKIRICTFEMTNCFRYSTIIMDWYLGHAIKCPQEIGSAEKRSCSFRSRTRCIWRFESGQSWRIETGGFSRKRGGIPLDWFVLVSFVWSAELQDAQIITGCCLDILQGKVGLVWMISVNTFASATSMKTWIEVECIHFHVHCTSTVDEVKWLVLHVLSKFGRERSAGFAAHFVIPWQLHI